MRPQHSVRWIRVKAAGKQAVKDKVKAIPPDKLAEFCRSRGIKWLAACDVDRMPVNSFGADLLLLAEFEQGYPKGWGSFKTEMELAALYDVVKVYLITLSALRDGKDEILAAAQVRFAS